MPVVGKSKRESSDSKAPKSVIKFRTGFRNTIYDAMVNPNR